MLWAKKNSYKEFDKEKKFLRLKNSPASSITFLMIRPLFCFEDTKNSGLLIFNSLKQKKLIFNFLLTVTEKN